MCSVVCESTMLSLPLTSQPADSSASWPAFTGQMLFISLSQTFNCNRIFPGNYLADSATVNANFLVPSLRYSLYKHANRIWNTYPSISASSPSSEKMSKGNVTAGERMLEGKISIITGGAAGIGEATARLFAKQGAYVIIADIADEAGKAVAESLSPCATYIHCDVTKEDEVTAAVDLAMEKYGRLDVMFNNAGITDSRMKSVTDCEMEEFRRVMDINVNGVMHGIKHAARVMMPNKKGSVISMASVAGIMGGTATYAYTAAKHAIVGLTKNAAAELGKYAIRVNCISPSGLVTDMTLKYVGFDGSEEGKGKLEELCNSVGNLKGPTLTVDDIAEAAVYLVSDKAKYVSGHNLVVDGGITVARPVI